MPRRPIKTLLLLAGLLTLASQATAQAPRQGARYFPTTPTTSRYLSLFNNGGGSVSTYFGVIRPQERQNEFTRQQNNRINSQQMRIDQVTTGLNQPEPRSTGQGGWFNVASPRNAYRDTSHYYFRWDDRQINRQR